MTYPAINAIEYLRSHRFFSAFTTDEVLTLVQHSRVVETTSGGRIAAMDGVVLAVVLTGAVWLEAGGRSFAYERGAVLSSQWAGPRGGLLFAAEPSTSLVLTSAMADALRAHHPALMRRLTHRLAASGTHASPLGPVWSGRRPFRLRRRRPRRGHDPGTAYEVLGRIPLLIPVV